MILMTIAVLLAGCSVHRQVISSGDKPLAKFVQNQQELAHHDFGFVLYDPASDQYLYERNGSKYYTPASNTKIFTLYTAKQFLGDSTIAYFHTTRDDTLFFMGAADPALLHSEFPESAKALQRLRAHDGPVSFIEGPDIAPYGKGWSWDDFSYAYQIERSLLPLYGNRVIISGIEPYYTIDITPAYFAQYFVEDQESDRVVSRLRDANAFTINGQRLPDSAFTREIPFITDGYLVGQLLKDTLDREIDITYKWNHPNPEKIAYGVPLDTLYKLMMRDSDNFIAEQLLLQGAYKVIGSYDTDSLITFMKDSLFRSIPDTMQWVDGSGLSRYNLWTPKNNVWILERILEEYGFGFIESTFATGGVSGTITDWYGGYQEPYVWAKTGTLSNKHCLSGYVKTNNGKLLIFSFMHHNYLGTSTPLKYAMERILKFIRSTY